MFNDIGFSEDGLAFTYDGNGNTIKDLNRNIASIQYNFLNLPEMIYKTDQSSVRYGYSWSGQRLMKMIGTDTTVYIRTATGEIAGEYTNSPSALPYLNILSMDNSAAGQRRKEAGSWKSYFHVKDHLGNIRATIRVEGSTQTCVSATDYAKHPALTDYPFGSVAREMNAATDENVKFRYQGKERDLETGYDYFEARTYDSQLGRFMQVDPMWESFAFFNSNVAMNNNPLRVIDFTGMKGDSTELERITIDPGHGDENDKNTQIDPGAVSGTDYEKDIVLNIANSVSAELKKLDYEIIQTRTDDKNNAGTKLQWRIDAASGAKFFISLHNNASDNSKIEGFSAFYKKGSAEGKALAEAIQESNSLFKDNGVKETSNLYVINKFSGVAVLLEIGFISNSNDKEILKTKAEQIGKEIAKGINNYLTKEKK